MDRSSKHAAMRDDALAGDVEGMMRAGRSTYAEEFKDPEPGAEDEPEVDLAAEGTLSRGTPPGMSEAEVSRRSELADALRRTAFPSDREGLLEAAREAMAPDAVLEEIGGLPAGREYANVGEVFRAMGHHTEQERF